MKKNWITITVLFLLATNIALVLILLISNNSKNKFDGNRNHIPHKQYERRSAKFQMHLAEELNMTKEQKEKLSVLGMNFHNQKRELNKNLRILKTEYFVKIAEEKPDETELIRLADSIGNIHVSMMILDHKHYQNIKSICTKQQAKKLDSLGKNLIQMQHRRGYRHDGKRRHGHHKD